MSILGALFGGSKSSSGNQSYDYLSGALRPAVETGTNALGKMGELLGGGFDDYLKNAGFNESLGEGLKGITGGKAAGGLLRSGSAGKAFTNYGTGLRKGFYDNYLGKLGELGGLGIGAAGTMSGAGQFNKGSSQGGIIPGLFG